MYKEILDILMEDIDDHDNIKEQILKNQLEYHFTNKNQDNKNVMDNAAVTVRRILDRFPLSNIIGIQPITDKENPTIVSGGLTYDIDVTTRPLQAGYPEIKPGNRPEGICQSDYEAEINQAVAAEIEVELVSEFLGLIADNAPEIKLKAHYWAVDIITETIKSAVKEVKANWIVTSPVMISVLQTSNDFVSGSEGVGLMGDIMFVGWLDNVAVYSSLWNIGDSILIGNKDPDSEDAPIVYAPEVMILSGNKDTHNEFGNTFTRLHTRCGKYIHIHDVNDQYRKITLESEENS